MKIKKNIILLLIILIVAGFLRFYNLMHDSPYFFNPDERNMAIAITQFKLPTRISDVPKCLLSQFFPRSLVSSHYTLDPNSCNLNPHFFAYGQFPLYLSYVSDQLTKSFINPILSQPITNNQQPASPARLDPAERAGGLTTSFPSAIFWLRFWSALTSTFTVLFVYLITKELISNSKTKLSITNYQLPIFAALMAAFSPGLIQSAHFGTTESFLTFFFMASVYLSIKLLSSLSHLSCLRYLFFLSLAIGLAIGSKATGIIFLVPPFIALTIQSVGFLTKRKKDCFAQLSGCWVAGLLVFIGSIVISVISSPYNLVEKQGFLGAVMGYERDVATGTYEAFYTRQFVNTTPILFQAEKIFPYALGWPVFVLGASGLLFSSLNLIKKCISFIIERIMNHESGIKNLRRKIIFSPHDSYFLILASSFLIYFLPNAFLFAKWTRFMTPVFPFLSIFAAYFVSTAYNVIRLYIAKTQNSKPKLKAVNFKLWLCTLHFALCTLSILPGLMFMSIYSHEDSRLAASKWIYENIPNNSYILSETANVVDIPLGIPNYNLEPKTYNLTVISFDFYHMDSNHEIFEKLLIHLEKADYIFIPSRRIFANYLRLSNKYPFATKYYQLLFSGDLGFEKVAEIPSYPSLLLFNSNLTPITYNLKPILTFPDEQAEETFTVFDHPVIRIYKKVKPVDFNILFNKELVPSP